MCFYKFFSKEVTELIPMKIAFTTKDGDIYINPTALSSLQKLIDQKSIAGIEEKLLTDCVSFILTH